MFLCISVPKLLNTKFGWISFTYWSGDQKSSEKWTWRTRWKQSKLSFFSMFRPIWKVGSGNCINIYSDHGDICFSWWCLWSHVLAGLYVCALYALHQILFGFVLLQASATYVQTIIRAYIVIFFSIIYCYTIQILKMCHNLSMLLLLKLAWQIYATY